MATAMQTANPALSTDAFDGRGSVLPDRWRGQQAVGSQDSMTLNGAVGKCAVLLLLLAIAGTWTWHLYLIGSAMSSLALIGGLIAGFILALITIFNKKASPITAPLYAVAEGLALGGISASFSMQYHGIVLQAILLTLGVCASMLVAYASRLIRPTEKFMIGVAAATGGIFIFYLITMVLGFFHIHVPLIFASGPVGIAFSVIVVIIAALNLVIDFGVIEYGVQSRAPKYMEWYGAFGLMVTLVWLYLEVLRLLAKLRRD